MKLSGSTILITGGGSGIGRGLAEALHARGNTVIVAGHRADLLDDVAAANPGDRDPRVGRLGCREHRRRGGSVLARHPGLNILINNAGVMIDDDPTAPMARATISTS